MTNLIATFLQNNSTCNKEAVQNARGGEFNLERDDRSQK